MVLTTLCSLLNVVINFSLVTKTNTGVLGAGIANVGKGITKGLNQLPYTQTLRGDSAREDLVCVAAQVLVALLDYQSGTARDIAATPPGPSLGSAESSTGIESVTMPNSTSSVVPPTSSSSPVIGTNASPSPKSNHFRYFLSKIHRPADMGYILEGILSILGKYIL